MLRILIATFTICLISSVSISKAGTTAKKRCENDLSGCIEADLCATATYEINGLKNWKLENYQKFIDEALRRNLNCGISADVSNLPRKLTDLSKAEITLKVQKLLTELFFDPGAIDGAWGGKTKIALEKFYASKNSKFDGKLDVTEIVDLQVAIEERQKEFEENILQSIQEYTINVSSGQCNAEIHFHPEIGLQYAKRVEHAYKSACEYLGGLDAPLEIWISPRDEKPQEQVMHIWCLKRKALDKKISKCGKSQIDGGSNFVSWHDQEYQFYQLNLAEFSDSLNDPSAEYVAIHEYFHAWQANKINIMDYGNDGHRVFKAKFAKLEDGSRPWFSEGSATYVSHYLWSINPKGKSDHLRRTMKKFYNGSAPVFDYSLRVKELRYAPWKEGGVDAYNASTWAVAYLVHLVGWEAFLGMHHDLKDMSFEEAFEKNFGMSSDEFDYKFAGFIANASHDERMNILPPSVYTSAANNSVSIGATNNIEAVQRKLNELGYNAGPADGIWGKKTKKALAEFLSIVGEKFDGSLDQNEFELLGILNNRCVGTPHLRQDNYLAETWTKEFECPAEVFVAKDISPKTKLEIEVTLKAAANEWGNFGPVEYWVLGVEEKAARELIKDYCLRRDQRRDFDYEKCLERETRTSGQGGTSMLEYQLLGAESLRLKRPGGSMGRKTGQKWGIHRFNSSIPFGFENKLKNARADHDQQGVLHEYFHAVQHAYIRTLIKPKRDELMGPTWFIEGGATYMAFTSQLRLISENKLKKFKNSGGANNFADRMKWKFKKAQEYNRELNCIKDMPRIRYDSPCRRFFYDGGTWAIAYLLNQTGQDALLENFYPNLEKLGWEGAFQKTFGRSSAAFYEEFSEFLKKSPNSALKILPQY
jgi:hypothetical protein